MWQTAVVAQMAEVYREVLVAPELADTRELLSEWVDPSANHACIAWAKNSYDAMQSFFGPGRYVNYLGDDEGGEEVVAAYGPNYRGLQQLKAKYDPDNFFRLNQNIQPKG